VDQRVAEVEVDAVRLVGQLAQVRVALALGERHRVGGLPAGASGLLLLRCRGGLGLELVVGALDRALDELAVQRPVDDDRPARSIELDQHAGGARLVDVGVGEPDLRRAVGVAVALAVQLLGLGVELLGLLPRRSSAISRAPAECR
jgi:hypothetical protein